MEERERVEDVRSLEKELSGGMISLGLIKILGGDDEEWFIMGGMMFL